MPIVSYNCSSLVIIWHSFVTLLKYRKWLVVAVRSMAKICRICLDSSIILVDMFADQREPNLADILNECVDCELKADDGLPKTICLSCIEEGQAAYKFKRKCEKSHKVLRDRLKMKKDTTQQITKNYVLKPLQQSGSINEEPYERFSKNVINQKLTIAKSKIDRNLQSKSLEREKQVKDEHMDLKRVKIEPEEFINCKESVQDIYGESSLWSTKPSTHKTNEERNKSNSHSVPAKNILMNLRKTEKEQNDVKMEQEEFQNCNDVHDINHSGSVLRRNDKCKPECQKDSNSMATSIKRNVLQRNLNAKTLNLPEKNIDKGCVIIDVKKKGNQNDLNSKKLIIKSKDTCNLTGNSNARNIQSKSFCKKSIFQCPHCSDCFMERIHLNKHILTHTQNRIYKCPHCPRAFRQIQNLQEHINIHERANLIYKCLHCPKAFNQKTELASHATTHKYRFKCPAPNCTSIFIERSELEEHVPSHSLANAHHKTRSTASRTITRKNVH